jgi:SpoIID/LytB domain protein
MRWCEVADTPAAIVAFAAAAIITLATASCTSTTAPAPGQARPPIARSTTTEPPPPVDKIVREEPELRIRIMASIAESRLAGPRELIIAPIARPDAARTVATPVLFRRGTSGWFLRDGAGAPVAFGDATRGTPEALSIRAADGKSLVTINDQPYPGDFVLVPRQRGVMPNPAPEAVTTATPPVTPAPPPANILDQLRFDIIEHVGLETYLPGVVAKEMLPRWSPNAYKVQAIAARSYAIHEMERSRAKGEAFDLESSQFDQVYGGSVTTGPAADAVRATRGMILTHDGTILRAYYSSTCGGRPAAAKDVWPTTRGFEFNLADPIQGTQGPEEACAFSPRYRWTAARPTAELVKRLSGYGRENGLAIRAITSLAKLEPATITADARPTTYRIFDAQGKWYPLSAEQLRNACNWTSNSGLPAITPQTRVYSGDVEFKIEGDTTTITGRGFGHGVGMCQFGAEGMSRSGSTPEQILMHYYPGAKLIKAY